MAFSRFILAGAFNTGLTYLLYLSLLFIMPYPYAYTATYIVGIAMGYILNSFWVFKRSPRPRSFMLYPFSYGFNYLAGLMLLWTLVNILHISKEIAPLIVVAITVPFMYLLVKKIFN